MTVQKLIDVLQEVENKSKEVIIDATLYELGRSGYPIAGIQELENELLLSINLEDKR